MLESNFEKLYLRFRANYYKRMVEKIGTRDGSLTATESYCVEIVYLLNRPTVSEFAKFLNISVPNANYKITKLVEKNYVYREPSTEDRREYHLVVTDKFLDYYGLKDKDIAKTVAKIHETFSEQEVEDLDRYISRILALMEDADD